MITTPYLRRIEVLIGPLKEWQSQGASANGLLIRSDGTPDTLRVKFNVTAQVQGTSTPTTISIYNLSKKTRESLKGRGTRIRLQVGWANTPLATIFEGGILAVTHQREGADIVSTFYSLPGVAATTRSIVSKTFAGGTKLFDVVKTIAQTIDGVSVRDANIVIKDITLGHQGLSFANTAADSLNRLARIYGFSWEISQGEFTAKDDATAIPNPLAVVSTKNGYLLRAEPILAAPFQQYAGVIITSLLHPSIRVGRTVTLESDISSNLNGTFPAHTVTHVGDSHSSMWQTTTESKILGF